MLKNTHNYSKSVEIFPAVFWRSVHCIRGTFAPQQGTDGLFSRLGTSQHLWLLHLAHTHTLPADRLAFELMVPKFHNFSALEDHATTSVTTLDMGFNLYRWPSFDAFSPSHTLMAASQRWARCSPDVIESKSEKILINIKSKTCTYIK